MKAPCCQCDSSENRTSGHSFGLDFSGALGKNPQSRLAKHPLYGPAIEVDHLKMAYRWLRVSDIFSLILCSDDLPLSGVIEDVPGKSKGNLTSIFYERPEPYKLLLDPWPYTKPAITLSVQTRLLAKNSFQDETDYRTSLDEAPWFPQTVTLTARSR
jgi:hypothetical protein